MMSPQLQPDIRRQYIETLIRLIELNNDDSWIDTFLKLRSGGYLPGGGAGSLNDWGPSYSGTKADAWFTVLYNMMRFLFDDDRQPEKINEWKTYKDGAKIRVIRCTNCNRSYQHPTRFEAHLAERFYLEALPVFANEGRLTDILKPELSFNSDAVLHYRDWLLKQYAACGITVYDFLFANYICPHCNQVKPQTEHDIYLVEGEPPQQFRLIQANAR